MYPDLFGIDGFSMVAMILLGGAFAILEVILYLKRQKEVKVNYLDFAIVAVFTILVGIVFAILFENVYEAIKAWVNGQQAHWTWAMTFYGGLFGGVITFLLLYKFYYLKHNPPMLKEILKIAPGAITLGHAFGRIGCFLSGCCYGIETDAWYGVLFPGHTHKVIPTQLFEMAFLFALALVLGILAFKKITVHTFPIYTIGYGVFRFIIEFFRGDERGQLKGLSPSQYWCILLILGGFCLIFLYNSLIFKKEKPVDEI